jgi:hypothetical protein
MMTRLHKYWGGVIDEAYMTDEFYFNIGKETYP